MIEAIGKILKGAFFVVTMVFVFGLGVSAGFFGLGPGDFVGGGLTGAATTEESCPVYECKLEGDKCELVETGKTTK
tara:strand:+ start:1311 stop:1538 length:228 start_codon:yes stop_codon:yes gene_type:complete